MESVGFEWLQGSTGVTAFFVLSGYLITTLALREESKRGRLCLSAFYVRRVFRILPAYYSVLLLYVILVYSLPVPHGDHRRDAFTTALPYFMFYLNEFGVRATQWQSPFSQSWSLGIEEKFYLVWPAFAFVLLQRRTVVRVCAIAAFLVVYGAMAKNQMVQFLWLGSYASILIGCLIAVGLHDPRAYRWMSVLGRPSFTMLTAAILVVVQLSLFHVPQLRGVFPGVVGLLLIGLVTGESSAKRFLSSGPLVYVETRSYGVYLVHLLALNAAELYFVPGATHGWRIGAYLVASVALSVVLAEVLYRVVEHPCIQYGRRRSRAILSASIEAPEPAHEGALPAAARVTVSEPGSDRS